MDVQRHFLTRIGKLIKGRQRNKYAVSYAMDIHDKMSDGFINEKSANSGNHFKWMSS